MSQCAFWLGSSIQGNMNYQNSKQGMIVGVVDNYQDGVAQHFSKDLPTTCGNDVLKISRPIPKKILD